MALFGRSASTVGLDVGSGLVKLVLISHESTGPVVSRVGFVPMPPDAIVDGEVMDPALVAQTVRAAFEVAGVKPRNVVTAIGGRDVIIKKIAMDRMTDREAREVIRWEAEQHVPFDMDNVELDFQILDPEGSEGSMQVLLVAAKRELVENKLALLSEAGIQPAIIDVDAFALHNAFELNHPEAMRGLVGLVNIGHETTNVNILEDGVPILTRDLPVGTRRFREDLMREQGLTGDQATRLVEGRAESATLLEGVVAARAEELAVGIDRAAAFLQTSTRAGAGLTRLFTAGGGSRIPGLGAALGKQLGLPVQAAHPLERLAVAEGALGDLVADEIAPLLMLPVGLALRDVA